MSQQLNVTSQITSWDESDLSGEDNKTDKKLSLALVKQQFSGDFTGSSKTQYVMSYQTTNEAVFTGFESLTLTMNDKKGEVILQHNGKFEQGVASSEFILVAHSGSGCFTNASGSGSFKSTENGQAEYKLTLELV